MSTKFHYVYRISNIIENKHYYGKRSSSNRPEFDLGLRYLSSSHDKQFISDQKQNPQNYKYKIIRVFKTATEAVSFEIRLHKKFDVGSNPSFYNKAKQTSNLYDTTGTVTVKDSNDNVLQVSLDDPRYLSGELLPIWKNRNHDEATISKMKETHKKNNHAQGSKNSQFGTCWIYKIEDGVTTNLKIKKERLNEYISCGWLKGRRLNNAECAGIEPATNTVTG